MTQTGKGYLFALITALCWSTSGLFVKEIGQSSFVIVGIQALIAQIFNLLNTKEKIRFTAFTMIVGFIQFMMHLTFVLANQYTTVGNAIVLQYSSMIFVLIYQSIDQRKKPEMYQIFVILLALTGMIIFFIDGFSFDSILGNGLAILSGAFFGLQFYLNTKEKADATSSVKIQYLISILVLLIYSIKNPVASFTLKDGIFLLAAGIITVGISGITFAKCIERIPAFSANVVCMSEVIFAPILALIFLKEWFTMHSLIGAILIILSLLYNMYKQKGEKYV